MKKIALFTSSKHILNRWKKYLSKYELKEINNLEDLSILSNYILLLSTCVDLKNNEEILIKKLLINDNKILILENVPNLENAQKWLSLGASAYGNTFMSEAYLNSSVESISKGLVWLIPDIATTLIKDFSSNLTNNIDNILKELTKTEYQIALLIKKGFNNIQISQELNISINTVKTHIKNIYLKLGVNDRVSFIKLFMN